MEYQAKQETNNMKSLFYKIKTFKLNMGGLSLRNARTIWIMDTRTKLHVFFQK